MNSNPSSQLTKIVSVVHQGEYVVPSADQLIQLIANLQENLLLVAKAIADAFAVCPERFKEMVDKGANRQLLLNLERVGRGANPKLAFASGKAERKLLDLPRAEQDAALETGVDVLEPDGINCRRIPISELSDKQIRQAFSKNRIRSLAEQRTWQNEHRDPVTPQSAPKTFKVHKDRVTILVAPFELTKQTMLQWLAEIN
jgi:hypothetical protein